MVRFKKNVTYTKISPKMMNLRDIAWNAEEAEEEEEEEEDDDDDDDNDDDDDDDDDEEH